MAAPTIGITADLIEHNGLVRAAAPTTYVRAVVAAGGVPIVLPPVTEAAAEVFERCDGFVFTGGDDPATEPFGEATDPRVTPVHPDRQSAESAVLSLLADDPADRPVLGVCLGMQMMALHAGGQLDQFMPDTTPTHADHWERTHTVRSLDTELMADGEVNSKHKQAISDPGSLRMIAVAHDGVCEAVADTSRRLYVGVQWHPERTTHESLGLDLFRRLIRSARSGR